MDAWLQLGDELRRLERRMDMAILPDSWAPSRWTASDFRPLRLSPRELAELAEQIRQVRIRIIKGGIAFQEAQRGTHDSFLEAELVHLSRTSGMQLWEER